MSRLSPITAPSDPPQTSPPPPLAPPASLWKHFDRRTPTRPISTFVANTALGGEFLLQRVCLDVWGEQPAVFGTIAPFCETHQHPPFHCCQAIWAWQGCAVSREDNKHGGSNGGAYSLILKVRCTLPFISSVCSRYKHLLQDLWRLSSVHLLAPCLAI